MGTVSIHQDWRVQTRKRGATTPHLRPLRTDLLMFGSQVTPQHLGKVSELWYKSTNSEKDHFFLQLKCNSPQKGDKSVSVFLRSLPLDQTLYFINRKKINKTTFLVWGIFLSFVDSCIYLHLTILFTEVFTWCFASSPEVEAYIVPLSLVSLGFSLDKENEPLQHSRNRPIKIYYCHFTQ